MNVIFRLPPSSKLTLRARAIAWLAIVHARAATFISQRVGTRRFFLLCVFAGLCFCLDLVADRGRAHTFLYCKWLTTPVADSFFSSLFWYGLGSHTRGEHKQCKKVVTAQLVLVAVLVKSSNFDRIIQYYTQLYIYWIYSNNNRIKILLNLVET